MARHVIEEEHLDHCGCGCPWWMDDPWVKALGSGLMLCLAALGVFAMVMYFTGSFQ